MGKADIGLVGLAVMGENLALNMASRGFTVALYNRTGEKVLSFLAGRGAGKPFIGAESLAALVAALSRPRKVFLMVKAGPPVDQLLDGLLPLLERGDVVIDGGNAHFPDTIRRCRRAEAAGLYYVGTGVSGGEEGALHGPSMMPGGSPAAWPLVKPIFQAICARTEEGEPCCDWVGQDGAGHFVKMVHNGIEYGDMQLICEAYHLMKGCLGMSNAEMCAQFDRWNQGRLRSYLIEITRDILAYRGGATLDRILDAAGQKGTGKWTAIAALDEGVPLTLIGEAVFARCLSAQVAERAAASAVFGGTTPYSGDRAAFLTDLENALYAAKLVSYAQGYQLMAAAAKTYGWDLNYGGIARMWRGGCIIRSAFLGELGAAYDRDPALQNLLLDPGFQGAVRACVPGWRRTVAAAALGGFPVPAFSGALSWFDGWRAARLPANLLQAQRDYFGAHGYERLDRPRGESFHTDWTGHGGATAAENYNV